MAKRPLANSFICISSLAAPPLAIFMGSKPKFPGTRAGSLNMFSMVTLPLLVQNSNNPNPNTICNMAEVPAAAGASLALSQCTIPGKVTYCCTTKPKEANMAARQCFNSASRRNFMSK